MILAEASIQLVPDGTLLFHLFLVVVDGGCAESHLTEAHQSDPG
jgi:hypothetical protein